MNNQVLTTANRYAEDGKIGVLLDNRKSKGSLMEYQDVVAIGPMVKHVSVGETVMINPKNYARFKHQEGSLKDNVITDNPVLEYRFPMLDIDGVQHLLLHDNDIEFVIEEHEVVPDKSSLLVPENKIIVN